MADDGEATRVDMADGSVVTRTKSRLRTNGREDTYLRHFLKGRCEVELILMVKGAVIDKIARTYDPTKDGGVIEGRLRLFPEGQAPARVVAEASK